MASLSEIQKAIKIIEKHHKKIIILHCVSNYPTKIEDANLNRIQFLKNKFKNYKIGLSDHTDSIFTSIASIPLGVCAIEKHFNIDQIKTPDSSFSINPNELNQLKDISKKIFSNFNKKNKVKTIIKNIKLRRSIFAKIDIYKGEKISLKNTISLRPLVGIGAQNIFKIIGKKTKKHIYKNSPIFFNDLKK